MNVMFGRRVGPACESVECGAQPRREVARESRAAFLLESVQDVRKRCFVLPCRDDEHLATLTRTVIGAETNALRRGIQRGTTRGAHAFVGARAPRAVGGKDEDASAPHGIKKCSLRCHGPRVSLDREDASTCAPRCAQRACAIEPALVPARSRLPKARHRHRGSCTSCYLPSACKAHSRRYPPPTKRREQTVSRVERCHRPS